MRNGPVWRPRPRRHRGTGFNRRWEAYRDGTQILTGTCTLHQDEGGWWVETATGTLVGRVRSWCELARTKRDRTSSLEERARRPAARPAILAMTQGVKYVRFGRRLQLQIGFHRALQNILNQVDAVLHGSKRFQVSGGDLPEHSIRQAAASAHVQ